ncbi:MAG: MlaD family protein, partial [Shewanella sp.]
FKALLQKPKVFWRNNALDINASLAGINVAVAPLQGALKGSISLGLLDTPSSSIAAKPILYANQSLAMAQAVNIRLTLDASAKLAEKAAIRYQGHQVGEVAQVKLNADLATLTASAYLYGEYAEHFSRSDSEYHLIDAQISLAGIKAPETLISGAFIGVLPGKKADKAEHFTAKMGGQITAMLPAGALKFTLEDSNLGAIKAGTAIFFRGIKIGQVDGYKLSNQGNRVLMQAHIEAKYRDVVNQSSQFWNASGIKVDAGIFSGVQIEAGNLESIIAGGINVATKDVSQGHNRLQAGAVVPLQHQVDKEWLSWAPTNRLVTP